MWNAIDHHALNSTELELMVRISNYIVLFYVDMITYPYRHPDAGWANLCL